MFLYFINKHRLLASGVKSSTPGARWVYNHSTNHVNAPTTIVYLLNRPTRCTSETRVYLLNQCSFRRAVGPYNKPASVTPSKGAEVFTQTVKVTKDVIYHNFYRAQEILTHLDSGRLKKSPNELQVYNNVNKYFYRDQARAYLKRKSNMHYYLTILKMGRSLNFTGHSRGYIFKLVKLGTLAREQLNQTRFVFHQPRKTKKPKVIRTTHKETKVYLDKTDVDLSIQFENFVVITQPTLAFFPIKRRSYKKKKKIYTLKHVLRIAQAKNRLGKLFSMIKHSYFRWKRRHNRIDVKKGMLEFIIKELIYFPRNKTRRYKVQTHERIGRDAVNDIIFRRRLENARST